MNWSRGLFRLWLVASGVWIILILLMMETFQATGHYLGGQFLRTDVTARELSVSPLVDGVVFVEFEGRSYELQTGGVQPSDNDGWAPFLRTAALKMNQDAAINNARLRQAGSEVLVGIGFATLPPLFVFALGASLLWAVHGFSGGGNQ